jgi:death-on-curing family protein
MKAAMLFYLLIKNHPFQNGNKRVAVVTLIYFLDKNGRAFDVNNKLLYEFSREIAASDAKDKDLVVSNIRNFIAQYSKK